MVKRDRVRVRAFLLGCLMALAAALPAAPAATPLPDGFVRVADVVPQIKLDIRFYNGNNFTGGRVDGYEAPAAILTRDAALALRQAEAAARDMGYGIVIWDAYRPQSAVDQFHRWMEEPDVPELKDRFYPNFTKEELFELDYIAHRSEHTRGSAMDLGLYRLDTGELLDMGCEVLMLDAIANLDTGLITPAQEANRKLLQSLMEAAGFLPYEKEWWHFHLAAEPYPDTYFNFPVTE